MQHSLSSTKFEKRSFSSSAKQKSQSQFIRQVKFDREEHAIVFGQLEVVINSYTS